VISAGPLTCGDAPKICSDQRLRVFDDAHHFASLCSPSRGQDGATTKVVLATSSEETRRQLVKDWWSTQEDSETPIVIATRRSDTGDFNDKVARP
jgi:hypothetical protein